MKHIDIYLTWPNILYCYFLFPVFVLFLFIHLYLTLNIPTLSHESYFCREDRRSSPRTTDARTPEETIYSLPAHLVPDFTRHILPNIISTARYTLHVHSKG